MKLFTAFKTPAWEQRDPSVRAAAVRSGTDPELLAKLAELALRDGDAEVRRAALARVQEAEVLQRALREERDAETRAVAQARLMKLLLDPSAGLAPDARLALLREDLPADLIERVAEAAPEVALRRAALERISRAAFLLRRCAEDGDAGLREWLLGRIDGEEALERLAENLRKRDKHLARLARERLTTLRLARGDAATLQQWALALCETLTAWAQALPSDIASRRATAEQEWQTRAAHFDDTMQRRVLAYFERLDAALARREGRAAEQQAQAAMAESATPAPSAASSAAVEGKAAARAAVAQAEAETLAALDAALKQAEHGAAVQRLGEAKPAYDRASALYASLPRGDRARRERLVRLEGKIAELEQWQRWSGNRVRARLCEDVEALIAAAPHPDAVAHRVRELQQEWARVEAAEPGDADRTSGLARRFRALCGRAMAPTRPYFEQRHALREQRRAALEALLGETTAEALAALAAPAIVGLRRRLIEALRGLDELEPKARTAMARRLREALGRIDAALDAQREDAALARRKLIARLRRELTHADAAAALELARQAQIEWKALPRAAREQEPALEQELAALIDPLFAREREQRDQRTAQDTRLQQESRRILTELEALATADAETLAHAEGRLAALAASWKEVQAAAEGPDGRQGRGAPGAAQGDRSGRRGPGRDLRGRAGRDERGARPATGAGRGVRETERGRDARGGRSEGARIAPAERAFDQAVAKVREAQRALDAARRGERLQGLVQAIALLSQIEQASLDADLATSRWEALALDDTDRRRLAARFEQARARSGAAPDAAADEAAERWLVEAELDAGLDSPAAAQALRRHCQMQRLAVRLQGATAAAPEARERLLVYAALGPLDPAHQEARVTRLQALCLAWSKG